MINRKKHYQAAKNSQKIENIWEDNTKQNFTRNTWTHKGKYEKNK